MEIVSCTGQVDIVRPGQRQQAEIRKNLMTRVWQQGLPPCLSSFLPSATQSHPRC